LLDSLAPEDREFLKDFAHRIGVSYHTLYNWLYGRHLPGAQHLMLISARVGRLVDELLAGVSEEYDASRERRLRELALTLPQTPTRSEPHPSGICQGNPCAHLSSESCGCYRPSNPTRTRGPRSRPSGRRSTSVGRGYDGAPIPPRNNANRARAR
jgi:hypothetical protein